MVETKKRVEGSARSTRIAVVVPVLDEVGNVRQFLEELLRSAAEVSPDLLSEIVFVDDGSTDGTVQLLEDLQRTVMGPALTVLKRKQAEGTVSAEIAGFQLAEGDVVFKIDGDLQHPPGIIKQLFEMWNSERPDLVVASRYLTGGSVAWKPYRGITSRAALFLARLLVPAARRVSDPLSGCFMVRRKLVSNLETHPDSYKLLLYILATYGDSITVAEVPFRMEPRKSGHSKIVNVASGFIFGYGREILRYGKISRYSTAPEK